MGKSLTYIPPITRDGKINVKIEEIDIKAQESYWKSALIGYMIGDNPYMNSMDNYVTNVWGFVSKPRYMLHDEGYYIFKFNTIEECDLVLKSGPYTYHNKPFILQNWKIYFIFNPECITVTPLWVTFPGLPVGYWSTEALSKVASVVGKPLHTDNYIASMEKYHAQGFWSRWLSPNLCQTVWTLIHRPECFISLCDMIEGQSFALTVCDLVTQQTIVESMSTKRRRSSKSLNRGGKEAVKGICKKWNGK